jgi:hypothetical protein
MWEGIYLSEVTYMSPQKQPGMLYYLFPSQNTVRFAVVSKYVFDSGSEKALKVQDANPWSCAPVISRCGGGPYTR